MDVLVDYLSFTSKVHSFVEILDIFKLHGIDFEEGSKRGWEHHLYFGGINIHYGGRDDVWVEMSGTGCRTLETIWNNNYDWLGLFDYLSYYGADVNVSRLDLACDEKDGILPLKTMMRHTEDGKYISLARYRVWLQGDERSVLFGSPKSSRRLRIYDKALERSRSLDVDSSDIGHWVRVEFQLRDEAADRAIAHLIRERHVGKVFRGLLYEYLRFTTSVPDSNRNYSRLSMPKWWDTFLDGAERLEKLTTGGKVYNMDHITSYIVTQCAPSLKAFIEGHRKLRTARCIFKKRVYFHIRSSVRHFP